MHFFCPGKVACGDRLACAKFLIILIGLPSDDASVKIG